MKKLMTTAAVLVAVIAPASALDRIPAKFIGDWRGSANHDAGSRYGRGSCREMGDGLAIHAKTLVTDGGETECKVLSVMNTGNDYLVRARCTTEEDTPRNKNFLISIDHDAILVR